MTSVARPPFVTEARIERSEMRERVPDVAALHQGYEVMSKLTKQSQRRKRNDFNEDHRSPNRL
jgi:hypothetical protein